MDLTNKLNLPSPVFHAVKHQNDQYSDSYEQQADISVTGLLNPPQQVELMRRHGADLAEDASDRIYALLGSTVHTILEHHCDLGDKVEERLYADVNGWTVAGQFDRLTRDGVLQDWKLCSVWESIYGIKPERTQQLNMLAWLCEEAGYPVHRLEIVSLYRDWSKGKVGENNYPEKQVEVHIIPMWSAQDQYQFMSERVKLHQMAREGRQVRCTPDDKWVKFTKYAVMTPGRKRAHKLFDSEEAAFNYSQKMVGEKPYIEVRHGKAVRCEDYCAARDVCTQYREEKI